MYLISFCDVWHTDDSVCITTLTIFKNLSDDKNQSDRVWRYQRGNQNPYIKDEQTTQWPKEEVEKDKQWSTKDTADKMT